MTYPIQLEIALLCKLSERRSKPLNHFYYDRRVPQRHHARLRMECSALQQHLFKKSLVESPLCTCGISETSKHFLLDCQNYHHNSQLNSQLAVNSTFWTDSQFTADAGCEFDIFLNLQLKVEFTIV